MKSPEKPIVTQALLYWSGAGNRTRTCTIAKPLAPETSASTNSATWAFFNHPEAQPIGIAHTKVIVFSN